MPINRTNINVQARTPGMILTTGHFDTNGVGAVQPDVDVGTTVARTGVGTYLVTFPGNGQINFRSVYVNAFDNGLFAKATALNDRSMEITITDGIQSPPGPDSVTAWHEADAAPGTTYADFPLITFPADGRLVGITAVVNANVAATGPGNGFSFTVGRSSGGPPVLLTGGSGNILDTNLVAFNPMDFTFTVPAELDVLQGESLSVNLNKVVNGQALPIHAFTTTWVPDDSVSTAPVPVDSTGVRIGFEVLIKNSSAR